MFGPSTPHGLMGGGLYTAQQVVSPVGPYTLTTTLNGLSRGTKIQFGLSRGILGRLGPMKMVTDPFGLWNSPGVYSATLRCPLLDGPGVR
jgi:hypothetical protein